MSAPSASAISCCLGHVMRLAAGKLHHMDRQAGMAYTSARVEASFREFAACHHLRHDKSRAVAVGTAAKGFVGDAGHRRQKDAVAYRHTAYVDRVGELSEFIHA